MYNVCNRCCRGQNRCNPPWITNTIWKIKFIFILYSLFMEDCTCLDLYSAYCIRCAFMDIDASTKRHPHHHPHHHHSTETCTITITNIYLIPIIAPEAAYPSFSVCFLSFDQLSFSSYRPIKMRSHPTSLERKLDVEEKRVIYAYNWWKRRPLRKIWLWNDLTFTDVTSACQVSIVDWYAGS